MRKLPILMATAVLAVLASAALARDRFPIEVTVRDVAGEPVESAAVTIRAAGDESLRLEGLTNRRGKFKAELPDFSRTYRIRVSATDLAVFEQSLDLATANLEPGMTAEVGVTLRAPDAKVSYTEGLQAMNAGDSATAEARFREAMALDSRLAEPYLGLGELLRRQKRNPESVAMLEKGAATAVPNLQLFNFLAFQLLQLDRPADALVAADRALALAPADAEALRSRYDALLALERSNEAEATLDQLAAAAPDDDTARLLFNAGATASNVKDFARARQRLQQALALDPKLHQAHSALAELHIGEQEFEAALAELDKVIAIAPRNFRAIERKVEVLRALTREADAAALEQQLAELRGN